MIFLASSKCVAATSVMSLLLSISMTVVIILSDRVDIGSLLMLKKSLGSLSLLIASTSAFFRRLSILTQKMSWRFIMKLLMVFSTWLRSSGPSSGGSCSVKSFLRMSVRIWVAVTHCTFWRSFSEGRRGFGWLMLEARVCLGNVFGVSWL